MLYPFPFSPGRQSGSEQLEHEAASNSSGERLHSSDEEQMSSNGGMFGNLMGSTAEDASTLVHKETTASVGSDVAGLNGGNDTTVPITEVGAISTDCGIMEQGQEGGRHTDSSWNRVDTSHDNNSVKSPEMELHQQAVSNNATGKEVEAIRTGTKNKGVHLPSDVGPVEVGPSGVTLGSAGKYVEPGHSRRVEVVGSSSSGSQAMAKMVSTPLTHLD